MRPPAILLMVAAFEAGLATGLVRFPAPWFAAALLLAASLLTRRMAAGWALGAMAVGIGLGGATRLRDQASCAARLPAGRSSLLIELGEPVTAGVASARVLGLACPGTIVVKVGGPSLHPAGARWLARGRWIPGQRFGGRHDGIFVTEDLAPRVGRPSTMARLRNRIAATIGALYGSRSGLVEALLVGRRGGIDPSLNAAFVRSGLVHLLSISGFHVGIVFLWVTLLLKSLRVGRHLAAAIATGLVVSYVAFLGWPAPALRAAFLAGLGSWSISRQRQPAAVPLLAVTCLGVTLLDPWALFDLGGWLSAAAFWGALTFTRWSDRALGAHAGWRMLLASVGASLATAPLTAAALGSVALAGIGLNFLAIPLAALAVPAVLASVVVHPVLAGPGAALAAGGGLGLAALEGLARLGSRLPFGSFQPLPGPAAALPWIGVLAVALWTLGRRNTSRRAALRAGWAVGVASLLSALPHPTWFLPDDGHRLALHFLSVGQGDATLIRTPNGRWVLVDAGPADERRDAGRAVVLPFLIRHGVRRLAAFVLTHAHLDHDGGAVTVLREVPADLILEPAARVAEPRYLELLDLAAERGMAWRPARAGDSLVVDGVRFDILHPDTGWSRWGEDLNDDSVVLRVSLGAFQAVLAGDLGVRAESLLAGRVGAAELLKVGHHGSAGSSGVAWLGEIAPDAAVIPVGPNRYGHPSPAALARLADRGVEVWRTDRDGSVSAVVSGAELTVRSRRGVKTFPLRP